MKPRLAAILLLFCFVPADVDAQTVPPDSRSNGGEEVFIPLHHDTNQSLSRMSHWIRWDSVSAEGVRIGKAPGAISIELVPDTGQEGTWELVVVPPSGDSLQPVRLAAGEEALVEIPFTYENARDHVLPFRIVHEAGPPEHPDRELFYWLPAFLTVGTFTHGGFSGEVMMYNAAANGRFTLRDVSVAIFEKKADGSRGRSFIDLVPVDDRWYEVAAIEADGSGIRLAPTEITVAELGARISPATVETIDGEALSIGSAGAPQLLVFWAQWCNISRASMDDLQRRLNDKQQELRVVAINVDEPEAAKRAVKVFRENEWTFPHVVSGKGQRDDIWRRFSNMEGVLPSVPLFVVIDRDGIARRVAHDLPEALLVLDGL